MSTASTNRPSRSGPAATSTKRNWLSEIKKQVKGRPTAAVIYGVPGVGKTSMAAFAPNPVFLTDDQEDGITTLKANGLVPPEVMQLPPAKSWSDVLGMLDSLAEEDHNAKTLVVDAMGGIEAILHAEVCRRDFNGDGSQSGFLNFQAGYDIAARTDCRHFLRALDRLRDEKNMGVILLAHSAIVKAKNPGDADFDKYLPAVHAKTWAVIQRWSDATLFANFVIHVQSSGNITKVKGKASGGQQRILYTENHAIYEAKNRFGLPPQIDMGSSGEEAWGNLVEAIKEARAANAQPRDAA